MSKNTKSWVHFVRLSSPLGDETLSAEIFLPFEVYETLVKRCVEIDMDPNKYIAELIRNDQETR